MSDKNQPTSRELVNGVLGGWVYGTKKIVNVYETRDGGVVGMVSVRVPAESVKRYQSEKDQGDE